MINIRRVLSVFLISLAIVAGCHGRARAQLAAAQTWAGTSGGVANAQTLTVGGNFNSIADIKGVPFRFIVGPTNTGPTTLTINSLTPLPVRISTPYGPMALQGGEMDAGNPSTAWTDGTFFYITVFNGLLPGTPLPLLAPRSYFANSSSGLDTNDCLTTGTSCQTIQHIINLTQSLNMNGYNVTINLAAGTYAPFVAGPLNGSGTATIIGNSTTPSSVVISATTGEAAYFTAGNWHMAGVTVVSSGNGSAPHLGCGVRASTASPVVLFNVAFGNAAFAQVESEYGSNIIFLGVLSGNPSNFINIVGSAPAFMYVVDASISTSGTNLNITGTPAYSSTSQGFAYADQLGVISQPFNSVTGSATGKFYNSNNNSSIKGVSTYPGSIAGTTSSGGQAN